jgi:hypothetical protein
MAILTFSEDALFYEEAYTNALSGVVARRHSTNVTVRVSASGGPCGGVFTLTRSGFDKLSFVEGDPLPEEIITLSPNETRFWRAEYAPRVHSETKDDVTLSARFEEYLTANTLSDEDKMTVVKVELSPVVMRDRAVNRHLLGVGERVLCEIRPIMAGVEFESEGGGAVEAHQSYAYYDCPLRGGFFGLSISVDVDSRYRSELVVVEPESLIVGRCYEIAYQAPTNTSGAVGMRLELYVTPLAVSFRGLSMMEIPDSGMYSPEGFLADLAFKEIWHHTIDRGAGVFYKISNDNYFFTDEPKFAVAIEPPWGAGRIIWDIPIGWAQRDAQPHATCIGTLGVRYQQKFEIYSTGLFRLSKFQHWVERCADGTRRRSEGVSVQ